MAAAVAHARQGHQVTVLEAARTLGGRARAVPATLPDGRAITLDNGQHILIGAYSACLQLMRELGVHEHPHLLRLPLQLRFADGCGLQLPNLPPPWDALVGIVRASGWPWAAKWALLRRAALWRLQGFACPPHTTVTQLCAGLPQQLMDEFIEPLCVSALNIAATQASGQVFLKVLQDSLFSGRGGSHMLLPRTDLTQLMPQAAAQWLATQGAQVHTGARVDAIATLPHTNAARRAVHWGTHTATFDHITLACPAWEAARLVAGLHHSMANSSASPATLEALHTWHTCAAALQHTAIATVYAWAPGAQLAQPIVALRSSLQAPAQFALDRGQLGGPAGLLALVVSASTGERETLQTQVMQQARQQLALPTLQAVQTIIEKRATFACTPGLTRPSHHIAPGLNACGDYVDGPYPATLEGAVRSGLGVAF